MNGQPVVIHGYYMHYKNNVYRLIKFASTDMSAKKENGFNDNIVIYQPQYNTPNIPDYILWARPAEMFFENMSDRTPRFRYMGRSEEEVIQMLNQIKLNVKPNFKKENMLDKNIADLVFGNYAIHAFAIHSETLQPQVLYNKNGANNLLILPEKDFFEMSRIDPNEKSIAKYLNELREVEKILK